MRCLTLGVLGHVDHGKTALVRALTGTDTDRLEEEKRRGISIVLGFAELRVPGGTIDLIDMPGHERFVRAMVAGATGMQAALLVVAANEGIRPQTIEHLEIARLLGVRHGVVALTKCDLVPEDEARRVGRQAADLAASVGGWQEAACLRASAVDGRGLDELRGRLAALLRQIDPVDERGSFVLPVDRVFAVAGFGVVVTGTLRHGAIAAGDEVEVVPGCLRARVRGLQLHGRAVEQAGPGRRVAVNLRGLERADLDRGAVLAPPGLLQPGRWLDVELRLLATAARPLVGGERLKLLIGTSETAARLRLLDENSLAPGAGAVAQLLAEEPIAAPALERFILRVGSPPRTVGGGRVLIAASARRRRGDDATMAFLRTIATAPPEEAVAAALLRAGPPGLSLVDLARLVGQAPAVVRPWAKRCGELFGDGTALHASVVDRAHQDLLEGLASFHRLHPGEPGLARERLRQAFLPAIPVTAAREILARLIDRGELVPDAGVLRLQGFRPPPAEMPPEAGLLGRVEEAFRRGGLAPPDLAEIVAHDPRCRQALRRLVQGGRLVPTRDRVQRREIVFHTDAIALARRHLASGFPPPTPFLVAEAGRILGISRKFSVPLLEHLDARGFTRRDGDRRVIVAGAALGEVKGVELLDGEPRSRTG